MNVNLKNLITRLNDPCRNALEASAGLCLSRTNYDVDIEHYFIKLVEQSDNDIEKIFRHYKISNEPLTRDLTYALDRLNTGNARPPALSPHIPQLIQEAWLIASVEHGETKVRTCHLLLALLASEDLARIAREVSREFSAISVEGLKENLASLSAGSAESKAASGMSEHPMIGGDPTAAPLQAGKTKALDQFTIDLTARA